MKATALANRLARDLREKSVQELTADVQQAMLDAINGSLQKLHLFASSESKRTVGGIVLFAPKTVSLAVTNESTAITGISFTDEQLYCTIRIDGDMTDNQIVGEADLLFPYSGPTGTVSATIYSDAVILPEPYEELISEPEIIGDGVKIQNGKTFDPYRGTKPLARPEWYWMEANARNQNPPAPSVIRFNTLPDKQYRLKADFSLSPVRVKFEELLYPGAELPMREDEIEIYLIPLCRKAMTTNRLWEDASTKADVKAEAEEALRLFDVMGRKTLTTSRNIVGTKYGY